MQPAHFYLSADGGSVRGAPAYLCVHDWYAVLRRTVHVIAGLDPAIHDDAQRVKSVRSQPLHGLMDARIKSAHDAEYVESLLPKVLKAQRAGALKQNGPPKRAV